MPSRIAHVTLVVPEYDPAISFYCEVLRFELLEDTDLGEGKRWVRVAPPGAETGLLLAKAKGAVQASAIGNQTGGRVGFFLHTDDFNREYDALKQAGCEFARPVREEPYGRVTVFRDPFGNLWDLIEPR
ncbi:MAG: extradiol dioxygenase [Ponticaulis sp.]|nr:extradiol dioxygenase [Ponticaulis sp.]